MTDGGRGAGDVNAALRRVHDLFVATAAGLGLAFLASLAAPGVALAAGPAALGTVAYGFWTASREVGDEARLDPAHAHWARTIRRNGSFIAVAATMLVASAFV